MTLTFAGDPSKSKTAHILCLFYVRSGIVPYLVLDAFGVNLHHREWPDWKRTADIFKCIPNISIFNMWFKKNNQM